MKLLNRQWPRRWVSDCCCLLWRSRANTPIESTLREGVELGYHTTVLSDAVAAFNPSELKASLEVNYRIYTHELLSTDQFVAALEGSKAK